MQRPNPAAPHSQAPHATVLAPDPRLQGSGPIEEVTADLCIIGAGSGGLSLAVRPQRQLLSANRVPTWHRARSPICACNTSTHPI